MFTIARTGRYVLDEDQTPRLGINGFICASLLTSMTLITGVQVFNRYVLGASLSWAEEIAAWLFIWLNFFGLAYGWRHGAFVSVDIFTRLLFPHHKREVSVFSQLCTLICYGMFTYGAYQYAVSSVRMNQLAPVTRLPQLVVKISLVLGGALLCSYVIFDLIKTLKSVHRED